MSEPSGDSVVLVPVPDLEPVVGDHRRRFDPRATQGVPAHVTVLFPFLPLHTVTPEVVADLAAAVAAVPAPTVTFARTARCPGVLWLDPEPAHPFAALTRAVAARWPEAPPDGGRFGDDVTPHLTVTIGASPADTDAVDAALAAVLPVTTTLREAQLLGFDGERRSTRHRLSFGL